MLIGETPLITSPMQGCDKLRKGLTAFEECRWQDAITYLREIVIQDPGQLDIAGKLAFALSQVKEYDEAIKILMRLCGAQPLSAKWPYMVGYQFYMRGAWKEAIEWFDKALSLNSKYIKALYRKSYAHFKLGQYKECIESLLTCIESWQALPPDLQKAERKNYGKANFLLGKAYLSQGLSLKARRPLQLAVQIDGDDPDRRYELGKCHLRNGDIESAIRELERANELRPGTDYVVDCLAQAYAKKGDFKKAEELYSAIPRHRRKSFILKNLGKLYLSQGRVADALEVLQLAVKKDRANHNIQYLLGKALEESGNKKTAVLAYQSAIDIKYKRYGSDFRDARVALERLKDEVPEVDLAEQGEYVGVVTSYDKLKGFGFISSCGRRIFFHITAVADGHRPKKGDAVTFQIEESKKGPRAITVRIVDNDSI